MELSPLDFLKIDIANSYGLDKLTFQERLDWFNSNEKELELFVDKAEEPQLYYAGLLAYRDTLKNIPTGYIPGQDACASGVQIMSCLTGCAMGAEATGLLNPNVRADLYTTAFNVMQSKIGTGNYPREHVKKAIMTYFYGSNAKPKQLFGEGRALEIFYDTMKEVCPGAYELRTILIDLWNPEALKHSWVLPDNHHVHINVIDSVECETAIPELGIVVNYTKNVNQPKDKGVSLAANTVHSIDSYIVREVVRRCNHGTKSDLLLVDYETKWDKIYASTGMVSLKANIVSNKELYNKLLDLRASLKHKPFEVVAIHDKFCCHANNMNTLRSIIKDIYVELAEGTLLQSIIRDITGISDITIQKLSNDLHTRIRNEAVYFVC